MTKVEELRGYLWNKVFGADYAKMDELIDSLIAAVREEEHKEPTDEEQARLEAARYAIWAAYFKTLYELLATGMKRAEATAVMGELPKFYGDALPIKGQT